MIKPIKKSTVKDLLPKRLNGSHKGDNGKVLIVGGSENYYGAPVLAGLGALRAGADLVYLMVPEGNFEATRSLYPDFIVRKFPGEHLTKRYAEKVINFAKKCDTVLIGPGIGENERTLEAVQEIVKNLKSSTILDADAISVLKKIKKFPLNQELTITPHNNEFKNLVDREIYVKEEDTKSVILLRSISMDLHVNILLKGEKDFISSNEGIVETNITGNAGMTVGGSGDVLAGVVAGLISQGLEGFDACRCAAYFAGIAGDKLAKKYGNGFLASELARAIAEVMK